MQKSGSERRTGTYHVELAVLRGGEIDFVAFRGGGMDNKELTSKMSEDVFWLATLCGFL